MRYKCTDCGQEYDVKPEFCDCGNNIFTPISDGNDANESKTKIQKSPRVKTAESKTANYSNFVDIPALLIFILCIILSVLSLIFIGRDMKPAENIVNNDTETAVTKSIPSIDKLWREKAPKITETVTHVLPEPVKVQEKKVTPKTETPKKIVQTTQKTQQNTQIKPAAQQTTSTMTEQEKQEIIQKLSTRKTPSQKTEPKKVEQPKTETPKVTEQPKQETVEVKAPDTAKLKKELEAYKIELRNRIGKDINFGAVIGDGNCAVTFKIDKSGKLVNRKFSVQSKNNSLNDAVYAAVMGNPAFKEPPAGYAGEDLTLTVTMYGGNFEVKLQ